jgi:hypothetical protein
MKLIGIRIDHENTEKAVKKNLKQEWYPFLFNYDLDKSALSDPKTGQPISDKILLKYLQKMEVENFTYNTTADSPDITIHAIVGKNGSGKSTILELFFRVINNFAFKTIEGEESNGLLEAKGISASLFYSLPNAEGEEILYCIASKWEKSNDETTVKLIQADGETFECNKENPMLTDHAEHLKRFFYTVAVNYSHYSFNIFEVDGLKSGKSEDMYDDSGRPLFYKNGRPVKEVKYDHWLNGLFHKNDGYLTPIVLNPMRTKGNFDVNKEQYLSRQRLIGILIIKPDFLVEYKAIGLQFNFMWKNIQAKLEQQSLGYGSEEDYAELLFDIYTRWAKRLGVKESLLKYGNVFSGGGIKSQKLTNLSTVFGCLNETMTSLDQQLHTTLLYLAYKSISISTKYLSFKNNLITEKEKQKIVEDTDNDNSHITLKIRQAKHHIQNRLLNNRGKLINQQPYIDLSTVKISIDKFIEDNQLTGSTIDQIFDKLYPANYLSDIQLQKGNETPVTLSSMSSGERQMLYSLSSVLYHLINLQSVEPDTHRLRYSHINILLDEVEMYYHPEYQRQFVYKLITLIEGLRLDKNKIRSINICIITHSPFLLSDILKRNILFLQEGTVVNALVKAETFGANVYDILKNGFFLNENALGCFVNEKIKQVIRFISIQDGVSPDEKLESTKDITAYDAKVITNLIGDPFIKGYLLNRLGE